MEQFDIRTPKRIMEHYVGRTPKPGDPACAYCNKPRALVQYRERRKVVHFHPFCARLKMDLSGTIMRRV